MSIRQLLGGSDSTPWGRIWCRNFEACAQNGLLNPNVEPQLLRYLASLSNTTYGERLAAAQEWLQENWSSSVSRKGLRAFKRSHPQGFDFVRVITRGTYDSVYAERVAPAVEDGAGGLASEDLMAPIVRGPGSVHDDVGSIRNPANPGRIRPPMNTITLHARDSFAWITSEAWWRSGDHLQQDEKARWAVTTLGLPYIAPIGVVALHVSAAAVSWEHCQRPCIAHAHAAGMQPWFRAWPDDELSGGHTVDTSKLDGATPMLERGAPEWVFQGGEFATEGQVRVEVLGMSDAANDPYASVADTMVHWQNYLRMAGGGFDDH